MKRNSINRAVALLLTLAIAAALCACGGGSDLSGTWTAEGGYAPSGFPDSIEFFDDGKCAADGMSSEYKLEGSRLMLSVMGFAYVFDYKLSGEVLTLSDGSSKVSYRKDAASGPLSKGSDDAVRQPESAGGLTGDAVAEQSEDAAETQTEDHMEQKLTEIKSELAKLTGSGKAEDALQYVSEQLSLLEVTYPGEKFDELEQLKADCADTYKRQTLEAAGAAFTAEGYSAALNLLEHSTLLLGTDDADINSAVELYSAYAPILYADFYKEYFYREIGDVAWGKEAPFKDNAGNEYSEGIRLDAEDVHDMSPSKYVYLLSGNHSSFSGRVCLGSERRDTKSEMAVRIYGDDTLLWESPVFTGGVEPVDFSVDISGYSKLTIESQVLAFNEYNRIFVYLVNGVLNP